MAFSSNEVYRGLICIYQCYSSEVTTVPQQNFC